MNEEEWDGNVMVNNVVRKTEVEMKSIILVEKMAILLPTGQWYAPSAVINDALIIPEYARVCKSMQEYARVC